MIAKLAINAKAVPNFVFQYGLLRYKGRIWIGQDPSL